jgi:hypothetical protein
MVKQISRENFDAWFNERLKWTDPSAGRYLDESARLQDHQALLRIRELASLGAEEDLDELGSFLRPWNVMEEGWGGPEYIRLTARQALCYLGCENPAIRARLEAIEASNDPKWRQFPPDLTRMMKDPYANFCEYLREVIDCINRPEGEPPPRPWWRRWCPL